MRRAMKAAAVAFVLFLATGAAHAQTSDARAKDADIRKLLRMTGSAELGKQIMMQLLSTMKKSMPGVPESFWNDFAKEVRTDELVDLVVPVYDRNLTHDDVKELIRFYDSPTGRKFVAVLPRITQDSMAVGEEWGRKVAERAMQKLQAQTPAK